MPSPPNTKQNSCVIDQASKIICSPQTPLSELYTGSVMSVRSGKPLWSSRTPLTPSTNPSSYCHHVNAIQSHWPGKNIYKKSSVKLLKFADDTTVMGLIQDGDKRSKNVSLFQIGNTHLNRETTRTHKVCECCFVIKTKNKIHRGCGWFLQPGALFYCFFLHAARVPNYYSQLLAFIYWARFILNCFFSYF